MSCSMIRGFGFFGQLNDPISLGVMRMRAIGFRPPGKPGSGVSQPGMRARAACATRPVLKSANSTCVMQGAIPQRNEALLHLSCVSGAARRAH